MTTCNYCHGVRGVVKKGKRRNKNFTKQVYFCKKCSRKFTPDDGFWKMKHTPQEITEAISLYDGGMSVNEASRHMWLVHAVKVSGRTVLTWFVKYSKLIKSFVCKLVVEVKGCLHFDEVVQKVKKKKQYYWGCKDSKMRYKFSGRLTDRGYEKGCKPLFKQVKKQSYESIKKRKTRMVSDKLGYYRRAFKKFFRNKAKLSFGVPMACKK